jgi:hypothetical protein
MTATPLIIGFIILVCALAVYCYKEDRRDLYQFRANLRPGECVNIRTTDGMVHARIIRKNTSMSFYAVETDSRKQHLVTLTNIYRP